LPCENDGHDVDPGSFIVRDVKKMESVPLKPEFQNDALEVVGSNKFKFQRLPASVETDMTFKQDYCDLKGE
jgi:hypothetical protein